MFELTQFLLDFGLQKETILFLISLPVLATLIAFARQIIGVKGFGIYTSLIIAFAFLALGLRYGVSIFVLIIASGTITRFFLKKLRLVYLPRMAIVLTIVAAILLAFFAAASYFSRIGFVSASVFAVLIMIVMVEKFISAQIEKGGKTAILLTLETISLAVASYFLVSWSIFQELVFRFPAITILVCLALNIFLGKWTGLRLFEYWRFKQVLKKD